MAFWQDLPSTNTPRNAENLSRSERYLTATAGLNGDFYVNIDGANTLATNDIVRVAFPTATTGTANARLSIDGGVTYKNIVDLQTNTEIEARWLQANKYELVFNGTNFTVQIKNNPIMLWSGSVATDGTVTLTETCLNFRYLLIRQGALGSMALCPVLTNSTRITGATTYNGVNSVEIIVPRLSRNEIGTQLTLYRANRATINFSTGSISGTDSDALTEVWGVR
jgi:hypothetical protein